MEEQILDLISIVAQEKALKEQLKALSERKEKISNVLLNGMEDDTLDKVIENESIKITYVAPVDRIGVNADLLKARHPEVFEECKKVTKVKSSLRITLKGE